jgi:type II secretory pathway component PulJ
MNVALLQLALLALGLLNLALLLRLSQRQRRQARTHAALVERLLRRRSRLARDDAFPGRFR